MTTYYPSLEQARKISASGDYRVIPVKRELYSDFCTPIRALRILQEVSTHTFLLESIEDHEQWGRYTFLGYHPTMEITCTDGHMRIRAGSTIRLETDHPGTYLRQILNENRSPKIADMPSFTGDSSATFPMIISNMRSRRWISPVWTTKVFRMSI